MTLLHDQILQVSGFNVGDKVSGRRSRLHNASWNGVGSKGGKRGVEQGSEDGTCRSVFHTADLGHATTTELYAKKRTRVMICHPFQALIKKR